MKTPSICSGFSCTLVICLILHFSLYAQQPIKVVLSASPPFSIYYDAYLEDFNNAIVTLTNTDRIKSYEMSAAVTIFGPGGLTILSREAGCTIGMNPGQTKVLPRGSFRDLCVNFNFTDASLGNLPDQAQLDLLANHILPEGNYKICLAFDDEVTKNQLGNGCFSFSIVHPERPVIIQPVSNAFIDGLIQNTMSVSWSHAINDIRIKKNTTYKLSIKDFGELGSEYLKNPNEAMEDQAIPPVLFEENLQSPKVITLSDLNLIDKHYYAIRIYAVNSVNPLSVDMKSDIVVVEYSHVDPSDFQCGKDFKMNAAYPAITSIIPFIKIPTIIKMEPYCNDYRSLTYTTNIKDLTTGVDVYKYTRSNALKWNSGPKRYLDYLLHVIRDGGSMHDASFDPNSFYSSHLVLGQYNVEPTLIRGHKYIWTAAGTIKNNANKSLTANMLPTLFEVGMPPPILTYPVKGEKVDSGRLVQFNVKLDAIPASPFPPYDLLQAEGNIILGTLPEFKNTETAILQVSRDTSFNSPIFAKAYQKSFSSNDFYDRSDHDFGNYKTSEFINQVYHDIQLSGKFSDHGTYYWRTAWLIHPETVDQGMVSDTTGSLSVLISKNKNDFYNISLTDSFKIGNALSGARDTSAQDTSGCGSLCEVSAEVMALHRLFPATGDLIPGTELKIGKFVMKVITASKSGDSWSGTGSIVIPFLRRVTVSTTFEHIKYNIDHFVYEGIAQGDKGGSAWNSLSKITTNDPVKLPIGWDKKAVVLVIDSMHFFPSTADMRVRVVLSDIKAVKEYSGYEIPDFGGTFCINPGGWPKPVKIFLPKDYTIDGNDDGYGIVLKGSSNEADSNSTTWLRWNCKGFECLQIAGDILLDNEYIGLDSGNETDDSLKEGRVKASFAYKNFTGEDNGTMITAKMDPFQLKSFSGWGFKSDSIFIDWSDSLNPPGMSFPRGYIFKGMNDPKTINTWKGIYMVSGKVFTPKGWGYDEKRTSINGAKYLYGGSAVGKNRYYLGLNATNIFKSGSYAHMKADIDTIAGYITSDEKNMRIAGKIYLPFADSNAFLKCAGSLATGDSTKGWNMLVQPGQDVMRWPVIKTKVVLDNTSYFTIIDSGFAKIKTHMLLNGMADFDAEQINTTQNSPIGNFEFLGLKFENFEYETGKGFVNTPHLSFSQASPQKKIGGFVFALDSINFKPVDGNPAIHMRPRISLASEESGFSTSVGLVFSADMDFHHYGWDEIKTTRIDVEAIRLHVQRSGFKLDGTLNFIKSDTDNGLEGIVHAELPSHITADLKAKFGNFISNPDAAHNTAENYTYWYVDGLATFGSSGVPLFAGINMYGLGGGLWYHMNQDNTTKIGYQTMLDNKKTDSLTAKLSGIGYTPSFTSNYGMKVQGLFGSSGNSKIYNMLLAVGAQFNSNGGPVVSIEGDAVFMKEIAQREESKAIYGNVRFIYNGTEDFIDGKIDLYASVKKKISGTDYKVLYGAQPNDRVVEALFHANTVGNSDWFFKMGEPNARAGLVMDAKIKKLTVLAYMMIGNGLPSFIPQPDPEFMLMLNANEGNLIGGGDAHTVIGNNKQPNATGFAFGVLVKDSFQLNPKPFYLRLKAIIGADVNITQSTDVCIESQEIPGIDGWYGTGQVYAGLGGTFGIHVDLFFIEGDFQFLKGSIATLLKAGLPNPSWFYGKGTMKYKVLGLVEGSHSIEFNFGDRCTRDAGGSPFGEEKIIQDLTPSDNTKEFDVYGSMQAAFSMPLNKLIELYDEKLEKNRTFRIVKENISLINKYNNHPYDIYESLENNDYTLRMQPTELLAGSKPHAISITVKGQEYINNNWVDVKGANGVTWTESKTNTFTTGPVPDTIKEVAFNYPITGQNYFLKNETQNHQGKIITRQALPEVLASSIKIGSTQYPVHYEAHFIPLDGNTAGIIKKPISVTGNQYLSFDVSGLTNAQSYVCNIMRVKNSVDPRVSQITDQVMDMTVFSDYIRKKSDDEYYKILPAKFITLGNLPSLPNERRIWSFYFRTSKFNSLTEKLTGTTWKVSNNTTGNVYDINLVCENLQEPFDHIDIYGVPYNFLSSGYNTPQPLVNFTDKLKDGGSEFFNWWEDPAIPITPLYSGYYHPKYIKDIEDFRSLNSSKNLGYDATKLSTDIKESPMVILDGYNSITQALPGPFNPKGNSQVHAFDLALNNLVFTASPGTTTYPDNKLGLVVKTPRNTLDNNVINWMYLNMITIDESFAMKVGNYNPGLYSRLMTFAGSNPFDLPFPPCFNSNVISKYLIPQAGYSGSLVKLNYTTPGSCITFPNIHTSASPGSKTDKSNSTPPVPNPPIITPASHPVTNPGGTKKPAVDTSNLIIKVKKK